MLRVGRTLLPLVRVSPRMRCSEFRTFSASRSILSSEGENRTPLNNPEKRKIDTKKSVMDSSNNFETAGATGSEKESETDRNSTSHGSHEERERRSGGVPRGYGAEQGRRANKNRSSLYYLFASAVVMLGLTYAMVPLYRIFCQVTGFGGTTQRAEKAKTIKIDRSKEFKVHFRGISDVSLPWEFKPLQASVDVYPGESTLAFYTATNLSAKPLIGVAMYTVHPPNAGLYFTKIECFCFDEQRINANETVNMPVLFRIDPEINKDRTLKNEYDIYLNYTFFLSNDQNIYFDEEANEYKTTSDVKALHDES